MDSETHIFVKNIIKVYPNHLRVVQYSKGFYKKRDGVSEEDLWADPAQYHQQIFRKFFNDGTGPLINEYVSPDYSQVPMPHARDFKHFQQQLDRKVIEHPSVAILARMHSLNVSMRRTKLNIVDIIACNQFDIFVTFSFGKDHYDIDKCKLSMSTWINNTQLWHRKNGFKNFSYILVPEYHADRKAIHFHALIKGYKGELKKSQNPHTGRQVIQKGKPIFNMPRYTLGFTNVSFIVNQEATARYLTKYVTKDIINLKGKRRYWYSRDLKRPEKLYNESITELNLQTLYEGDGFTISRTDDKLPKSTK